MMKLQRIQPPVKKKQTLDLFVLFQKMQLWKSFLEKLLFYHVKLLTQVNYYTLAKVLERNSIRAIPESVSEPI